MTEDLKKEIVELLENLTYWDTCPQNYKDRIPTMIEALKQGQSLPIDSVVGQSEQLCDHPTNKRASFKSHGKDFCWKCGKHIEA